MQSQLRAHLPISPNELQNLLRSPDALPVSHRPDLSGFISDAEHDIQAYENQIEQTRMKQALLRLDIARCSSVSSSIRRLPSELLQRIFAFATKHNPSPFCSPPFPNIFGCQVEDKHIWSSVGFALARVCHRWREVALATPAVWSNFAFEECERAIEPVRLCILRSSSHDISFHITITDDGLPELTEMLLQHAHRWSYFNVDGDQDGFLLRASDMPKLTSAGFPCHGGLSSLLPKVTSKLESATVGVSIDINDVEEHLKEVRHLTMEHSDEYCLERILNILPSCAPSLESLIIRGQLDIEGYTAASEHEPFGSYEDPILLPNLQILHIDLWREDGVYLHLKNLFPSLTLPSVQHIFIWGECPNPDEPEFMDDWPRQEFHSFLLRSQPSRMVTLELTGMPLHDTDVIHILTSVPTLEELTLHEQWACVHAPKHSWKLVYPGVHATTMTVSETLLKRLTASAFSINVYAQERHPLVPKLKCFRLAVLHHFTADIAFVEMAKSRWFTPNPGATERLKEVSLTVLYRELDSKIYAPLKALERDGMMVTVMGNGSYIV
ncbi:hypothetical protein V5O48_012536 [Marasmius crinis-equi]|uniref:F-box domain-containing protein n=1 Tax=Marasmius crinis-equi TaxID=585013 RepID=A0ABR3F2J7_9AGAR